jgi:2-oxoglutarate ferredoxin oxidoreductase subunit alpha
VTTYPQSSGVSAKPVEVVSRVVIRFAGDSGDGMQLTGERFTAETAGLGNDIATFPDFPAEIRAPAGTVPGVSAFQLQFADTKVLTPGDHPDVLVAMNPAALKSQLPITPRGATIVLNTDEFTKRNLAKVGYETDPRGDGTLDSYRVHEVAITGLTLGALEGSGLGKKDAERAKNMFALGLMSWLYNRPREGTLRFIDAKFARKPLIAAANVKAFEAGWSFGETTETFAVSYEVAPAPMPKGLYRNITGNLALSYGLVAAAQKAGLALFLGSYPITPASDILHTLSGLKRFGVRTFQAEDEIASIGAALGASFGGSLGLTTTSGPGVALKTETIGLAVSLELPLIIVDVQRGGPSTGLPTKTEQADLFQAVLGRNGESPVPVIAPQSPADCFDAAMEAVRIAVTYRTPVFLLSDGYLANGSEPWLVPDAATLPVVDPRFTTEMPEGGFLPYSRDPETLARPWALPGTPGLEHRIGGLEKADGTGNISYDPANHDTMVRLRAAKVAGIARSIPPLAVDDPSGAADVLVLGWGSTYGPIAAAIADIRSRGGKVAQAHLRHLAPFPTNTGEVLRAYRTVLIPEMNLGQLSLLIRGTFLIDAVGFNQVRGMPFTSAELIDAIEGLLARTEENA